MTAGEGCGAAAGNRWQAVPGSRSIGAFPRIGEMLYPFVLTQFRTENRNALSWN